MFKQYKLPFNCIICQDNVKTALLVAIVNPRTGGLLIGGRKGSGKSTLARSIQTLDKQLTLCELPLNITEDVLFGGVDIEYALQTGKRKLQAGLIAKADKRILYIDDANLLRPELLGSVLDTAQSGIHRLEREGISLEQQIQTTVVATMNPEEGTIAKPLLDRFGMYVETDNITAPEIRSRIVQTVLAYEADKANFISEQQQELDKLFERITQARSLLLQTKVSEAMLTLAASLCAQAWCEGHRGEFYLIEAAKAIAALAGRNYLLPQDMEQAAVFVLPHRMRQPPVPEQPSPPEQQEQDTEPTDEQQQEQSDEQDANNQDTDNEQTDNSKQPETQPNAPESSTPASEPDNKDSDPPESQQESADQAGPEECAHIDRNFPMPKLFLDTPTARNNRKGSGKRSLTRTTLKQGRYVRANISNHKITDLAFDATIRAAAPYQRLRSANGCAINIATEDLREKIREKRIGNTFLFVVDASGSMGARERMSAVKGAIFQLLQEAYQKRDRVGLIVFRRDRAELLLPVTRSVELAQKELRIMTTGGKTPLAAALKTTLETLYGMNKKDRELEPIVILVTDGRANYIDEAGSDPVQTAYKYAEKLGQTGALSIVIDSETDFIKLGIARTLAAKMQANYYQLDKVSQEKILHIVQKSR